VNSQLGHRAKLPCATDLRDDKIIVKWLDPLETDVSENYRVVDDRRYAISDRFQGEWNLEIKEVRRSDQGNYTCRVFTTPNIVRTVQLLVTETSIPCNNDTCKFRGECQNDVQTNSTRCVCTDRCEQLSLLLCGSNGKTYANPCQVQLDECRHQVAISVHLGTCNAGSGSRAFIPITWYLLMTSFFFFSVLY